MSYKCFPQTTTHGNNKLKRHTTTLVREGFETTVLFKGTDIEDLHEPFKTLIHTYSFNKGRVFSRTSEDQYCTGNASCILVDKVLESVKNGVISLGSNSSQ